jgi:protoheme IX farnesyltransferase
VETENMTEIRGTIEDEVARPTASSVHVWTTGAFQKLGDYYLLSKFRLTLMVLASGLVSFWLASGSAPNWERTAWFSLGTFLTVAGANAFNQVAERSIDRLMQRTANRPLPAGRMNVREALLAATVMSAIGLGVLAWTTHLLTFVLAALAMAVYLLVYTPLKRMSHWSTFAGAISGAIPTLMGWSAVRNGLDPPAWALFGILFLWQFPHTWSIVSAYREDFTRAGYQVLPLIDPQGRRTRDQVIGFSLALALVSLLPAAFGVAGPVYAAGALVGGLGFITCAVRFGVSRTRRLAAQLMAASLVYMPLILALLLFDRKVIS